MIELPQGDPTVREQIMEVFKKRFEDQQAGLDGAAVSWHVVTREPLSSQDQSMGYTIGMYDTSEQKSDLVGRTECRLNVVFEWYGNLAEGDPAGTIANAILGDVQRVAMLDLNMTNADGRHLSIDVSEKGSEIEIDNSSPAKVHGVVIVEVKYRHKPGKPTVRA